MKYIHKEIRRQDRLLEEEKALSLLEKGEYGIVSMVSGEEGVYGIPISYVWDKKQSVYFHCAPEGKKLRLLEDDNRVSFCVVGETRVISNKFTTAYESIIMKGRISADLPEEERMVALELLLEKYSPNDKIIGKKYAEKSFHRTAILRLDIEEYSGKSNHVQGKRI